MNSKFLTFTSFLIALLCHLAVFNSFTFVFPIDPVKFKPKLFFLGPMLKQSDVRQALSKKNTFQSRIISNSIGSTENNLRNIRYKTASQVKNPFAIQTIEKPPTLQTTKPKKKIILKSTFESSLGDAQNTAVNVKKSDAKLKIQPYRPLRFRSP